jgi:hypothetical protein
VKIYLFVIFFIILVGLIFGGIIYYNQSKPIDSNSVSIQPKKTQTTIFKAEQSIFKPSPEVKVTTSSLESNIDFQIVEVSSGRFKVIWKWKAGDIKNIKDAEQTCLKDVKNTADYCKQEANNSLQALSIESKGSLTEETLNNIPTQIASLSKTPIKNSQITLPSEMDLSGDSGEFYFDVPYNESGYMVDGKLFDLGFATASFYLSSTLDAYIYGSDATNYTITRSTASGFQNTTVIEVGQNTLGQSCYGDNPHPCSYYSESTSCSTAGCEWAGSECTSSPSACSTYGNQGDCENSGCIWGNTDFSVYRGYLLFDTSNIPDNAVVTNVTLSLNITIDNSINDFNISIYDYNWQSPITTANRQTNYDATGSIFDSLLISTIGIITDVYYNKSDLNTTWVNLTGNTYYQLRGDNDVNGFSPNDSEYVSIESAEVTGGEPILYVEYSLPYPDVSILYPTATNYNVNVSELNYSTSADNCWYSLDNGATNSTTQVANTNWTGLTSTEGSNTWRVYCNDSSNNINDTESVTFNKDTTYPDVSFLFPTSDAIWFNAQIELNVSETDTNIGSCWWTNDSGTNNYSLSPCGANITGQTFPGGLNTIIIYANDTYGNENSSTRTFNLDTVFPKIDVVYPTATTYSALTQDLNYTWTETNPDSCWYDNITDNSSLVACGTNWTAQSANEGSNTWTVWINDSAGNINSSAVTFTIVSDSEYPQFSNYQDTNGTLIDSGIGDFNVTITSTNGTVLLEINNTNITATNDSYGGSIYNATYNFAINDSYDYLWHSWGNGSSTFYNQSELQNYLVNGSVDSEYPQFSAYAESPANNTPYSSGAEYDFNVTLLSTNGTVGIEFNGINYTSPFNDTNNIFNFSILDLSAGYYEYYWWSYGNGTNNYFNYSETRGYTIAQADLDANLTASPSWSGEYPYTVNITFVETNTGDGDVTYNIYQNDSGAFVQANAGDLATWEATTITYKINSTGGQNYTSKDNLNASELLITPNSTLVLGLTATTPVEYPFTTDFIGSNCPSEVSCSLNISNGIYEAGVLNANYSTAGNNNYSASSTVFAVTINQNSTLVLGISGTTPISYPQITDVAGSGCPAQLTCALDKSNIVYGVDSSPVTFNYSSVGNTNYTAVSITKDITINQNTTYVLGITKTTPITYGTTTDFAGTGCPSEISCTFNISNAVYDVGTVYANYSTAGNVNYSANSIVDSIVINQAIPQGSISGTSPINFGTAGDVTGTETNTGDGDVGYGLFRDNVSVTNPDTTVLGAGVYEYIYNATAGTNYTNNASIGTFTLTVNKDSGACSVLFNETSPLDYPASFIVYTDCTSDFAIYRNGTIVDNASVQSLGASSYNFTVLRNDTQNYTNIADEKNFVINPIASSVYMYLNNTRADTEIQNGSVLLDINATLITGEGIITVYMDNVIYNSGSSPLYNQTNFTDAEAYHNFTVYYEPTQNYTASYETFWLNVTQPPDLEYPQFSAYTNSPDNNTEYSPNTIYEFNVTVTSTNGTVGIEFNGTNYTSPDNVSNVFNVTFSGLSAGIYGYYWWTNGNGTDANFNSSEVQSYTIAQNSSLVLGISGTTPITYGTITDVAGSNCPSELTCSLDKANIVYSAGTETFNYSTVGNDNYTASSITKDITINQAVPSGALASSGGWTINYGDGTNMTHTETNTGDGDVTYNIYIDNVLINEGTILNLSVGTYSLILNTTGGINWTANASMDTQTLTVNQIKGEVSLTFDVASPQNYGTAITPTCSVITGETTTVLQVNGTTITSGSPITLGAGTWNFNCSIAETTNYSSNETSQDYTINPIASSVYLYLDNTRADSTIDNGTAIDINATINTGDVSAITLYFDNAIYNQGSSPLYNNTNFTDAEAYHNFTVVYEDTQNYTRSYETWFLNVTQAPDLEYPQFSNYVVSPNNNTAYVLGAQYDFNVTISQTNSTAGIEFNGTNYSISNDTATNFNIAILDLAVGDYTYYYWAYGNGTNGNFNYSPTQDYSVSKATPIINLYLNHSESNLSINEGDMGEINGTETLGEAGITLYQDGNIINQGNSPLYNNTNFTDVGFFNITLCYDATDNYTSSCVERYLNVTGVDKTPPSVSDLNVNPSSPAIYSPTQVYDFNATIVNTVAIETVLFEFDGVNYTATNEFGNIYNVSFPTLGVGSYNYRWFANDTTGNVNNTETGVYEVDQATSSIYLYLDNARSDLTIYNSTKIDINATLISGEDVITISMDTVIYNSGNSPLYNNTNFTDAPVVHTFKADYASTQNYTASSETWTLTVLEADVNPPTFDNLRNFTQQANLTFSQYITASDPSGIDTYTLNDTSTFNISSSGLITNLTTLDEVNFYWLNISVNDTLGNLASGIFYINISEISTSQCGSTFTVLKSQLSNSRPYGQLCRWMDFR